MLCAYNLNKVKRLHDLIYPWIDLFMHFIYQRASENSQWNLATIKTMNGRRLIRRNEKLIRNYIDGDKAKAKDNGNLFRFDQRSAIWAKNICSRGLQKHHRNNEMSTKR